ncbi:MAG: hypothetical protein RIA08_14615 [Roseovarius sp.]|uniref:hypothetical protein n=1 Tax=Roseovarius sp. TaxID=1486281 RepID=UPI0032EAB57C
MDIHAIFDENFSGPPAEAAWIVESAANREWFAAAKGQLHPDSAIFSLEQYRSVETALCHVVWGIEEHFPKWRRIIVLGLAPTFSVPMEIEREGRWERRTDGFVLYRT